MVTRKILIRSKDVVLAKGIIEALEGVASVFAEHGGELTLAAPTDREEELDAIANDLASELGGVVSPSSSGDEGAATPTAVQSKT